MTTPDTASTAAATAAAAIIRRAKSSPFGSVLADSMSVAHFRAGAWTPAELLPTGPLPIHPAAHALHYGSECFEGFKAYRHADGSVQIFRLDRHVARLQQSARALMLPEPDAAQVSSMVISLVDRVRDIVRCSSAPCPTSVLRRSPRTRPASWCSRAPCGIISRAA
jgi:hypothetical protein